MVHEGIPIKYALSHLDDVEVVITQGHSIPQHRAISRLVGLSIAVLADYVLYSIELRSAVVGVHHDLLAAKLALLLTVNQVVLVGCLVVVKIIYYLTV